MIILYSDHPNEPASEMAAVWMKLTWKVSVNIAPLAWFLNLNTYSKQNSSLQISTGHNTAWETQVFFKSSVCLYLLHMYGILDTVWRSTTAWLHQTNSFGSSGAPPPPRLTCSVLQWRGGRAQNLPQSCLLKSLEWTDSTGHARQTRGLFFAPPPKKKGLTLLFTLPVKYYRSFM